MISMYLDVIHMSSLLKAIGTLCISYNEWLYKPVWRVESQQSVTRGDYCANTMTLN